MSDSRINYSLLGILGIHACLRVDKNRAFLREKYLLGVKYFLSGLVAGSSSKICKTGSQKKNSAHSRRSSFYLRESCDAEIKYALYT
jgi:hypothetical protein